MIFSKGNKGKNRALISDVPGYRQKGKSCELLDQAVLPDYFEVDHVHVFDNTDMRDGNDQVSAAVPAADDEKPVFMF